LENLFIFLHSKYSVTFFNKMKIKFISRLHPSTEIITKPHNFLRSTTTLKKSCRHGKNDFSVIKFFKYFKAIARCFKSVNTTNTISTNALFKTFGITPIWNNTCSNNVSTCSLFFFYLLILHYYQH
jgi:hypothetical protein